MRNKVVLFLFHINVKGVSRDRFYRYQELVEEGGVEALVNRSRRVPKNHSSRVLSGYVSKTFIRGFRKTSG
ncbi:MAG: helix-turn-helix domain-containing protein [Candidatus Symbiodolus clandestinus]